MIGKSRNFGLDVVRAISIILVVLAHKFSVPYELGIVGVQIFFVLSGFLIGQILIKDFKERGKLSTIINFWKRRWYRTLPLYYLILILKIIVYGNPYGWKIIVYFVFLQANFVGINFFGVSWSLVVEEWFYIFLPIATYIFFKKGIQLKQYAFFLFSFILFFLVIRFFWNYCHKGIIIYQFDCLLLGVFLALLKIYKNNLYKRLNSNYFVIIGVSGIVGLTIMLGDIDSIKIFDTFYRVLWFFLISVCVSLIIPFFEQSVFLNTFVEKSKLLFLFFTWTSVLTYSIYLIHMEVFKLEISVNTSVNLMIQFFVLYLVSLIVYVLYEHPIMKLRDELSWKQYFTSIKSFSLIK